MPERHSLWLIAAGLTLVVGSAPATTIPALSTTVELSVKPRPIGRGFTVTTGVVDTSVARARPGAPTHVDIAAIGVSSDIGPLGLRPDGTVQVPTGGPRVGWYEGSVVPGAPGASVLLGHTSRAGAAVFNRLHELRAGDEITVGRADAAVARFVVDRVTSYDKSKFPTLQVYGPSPSPVLRLVTCAGLVDGRFTDNLVVFAHLEAPA